MPDAGMPDASLWKGRRVFITGHTGFVGSWLSTWLTSLGATVGGYALEPDSQPNMFEALSLADRIQHTVGDIRNLDALSKALAQFKPEVVFHLAAQPLVLHSYADPVGTYATNVMGTAHVLEAARTTSTSRAIVIASSDKCYQNREWVWGYREIDPLGGTDPYSSSKACTELVVEAYRESFFPPDRYAEHGVVVTSVRAGNVLGGGDWSRDRLFPDAIRAFTSGAPVVVRFPNATRPWQHVIDPVRGYLMLAERALVSDTTVGGPWNLGPDDTLTVKELVDLLAAGWGNNASWSPSTASDQLKETGSLLLSSSKAHRELGWHPAIPISECLTLTIDWYKTFYAGATPDELLELTSRQIGRPFNE